jgi:hypothetical protein
MRLCKESKTGSTIMTVRSSIGIWFSIISCKVIYRDGFLSLGNLEDKMVEFIEYHNEYRARSYAWISTGKLLSVYRKAA